jgi:hypothetical protein
LSLWTKLLIIKSNEYKTQPHLPCDLWEPYSAIKRHSGLSKHHQSSHVYMRFPHLLFPTTTIMLLNRTILSQRDFSSTNLPHVVSYFSTSDHNPIIGFEVNVNPDEDDMYESYILTLYLTKPDNVMGPQVSHILNTHYITFIIRRSATAPEVTGDPPSTSIQPTLSPSKTTVTLHIRLSIMDLRTGRYSKSQGYLDSIVNIG